MPKLLFRASVLTFDKIFKKLNTALFNFFIESKDKIKRLALVSDYRGQLFLELFS